MSKDAVRIATPEDNPKLVELERSSPQGSKLQIYSERKDYFFRSTLYGNQHTLLAVDNQADRLIGVMAGTLKEVFLGERATRAAFVMTCACIRITCAPCWAGTCSGSGI